jgi:hypothetical protein
VARAWGRHLDGVKAQHVSLIVQRVRQMPEGARFTRASARSRRRAGSNGGKRLGAKGVRSTCRAHRPGSARSSPRRDRHALAVGAVGQASDSSPAEGSGLDRPTHHRLPDEVIHEVPSFGLSSVLKDACVLPVAWGLGLEPSRVQRCQAAASSMLRSRTSSGPGRPQALPHPDPLFSAIGPPRGY